MCVYISMCVCIYIYMYELQSKLLKGGHVGDCIGTTVGVIQGDTRSLDYGSYIYIYTYIQLRFRV